MTTKLSPRLGNVGLSVQAVGPEAPHPDADKFLHSLGRLVFYWGQVESILDTLQKAAINVSRRYGIEEEPQVSLSRKLRLVKRIYQRTPALAPHVGSVRSILKLIAELGRQRHDYIHSSMAGISPTDPPRLVMYRNKLINGRSETKLLTPTLAEIDTLVDQIFGPGTANLIWVAAILISYQEGEDKSQIEALLNLVATGQTAPSK